jgi:hypothetical protein
MKCEFDKELLTLYMNNQLTPGDSAAVERHITDCAECRAEFEAGTQLWALAGEIPVPEPSANMQLKFDVMLETYKDAVAEKQNVRLLYRLKQLFIQPAVVIAYSVILLLAGAGIGLLVNRNNNAGGGTQEQMATLTTQVHDLREAVTLSLLQNPSASERMRGVSFTSEIKGENKNVITALFSTLNNDDNTNVRLVTLEALTHYANYPAVREGLIESIEQQDSPLVQSALADIMLKLQEKRSIKPFKKLLQQKDLNNMVRSKIQETITQLI